MPISPLVALSKSPAAKLDAEEREKLTGLEGGIDAFLSANWTGGQANFGLPAVGVRLVAAIVRRYESKGWAVQVEPRDGALGKAAELLAAGAAVDWALSLIPRWGALVEG